MSLENEIFETFFSKLRENNFPENKIEELQKLWKNKKLASKTNILKILAEEQNDATKNKKP